MACVSRGRSDNDEGPANMAADFGVSWLLNETGIEPWRREYPYRLRSMHMPSKSINLPLCLTHL